MSQNIGTMTLKTQSAVALWNEEITGQLSDGMWENANPHDHWKFWNNLECKVGEENRVTTLHLHRCLKNSYRLSSLYPIIGDRMVTLGRMGELTLDHDALKAAEYMPPTMAEFSECKSTGKWRYTFVAKYMEAVNEELASRFYAGTYDLKSLKKDIACIKEAMKSLKI